MQTRKEEVFRLYIGRSLTDSIVTRIIQDELPFPVRGSIPAHQFEVLAGKTMGKFKRVRQGRCRKDKLRAGSIVPAESEQPSYQEGNMGSKDTPVTVRLIKDDEFQVRKKRAPFGMPGKDLVQFMGVGENNPGVLADSSTLRLGSVPVIYR